MTLDEELDAVERLYPKAWQYLMDIDPLNPTRPSFDDNDEMYFTKDERSEQHACVSESRAQSERQP